MARRLFAYRLESNGFDTLFSLTGTVSAAEALASREFQVTEDEGRISVRANDAPVSELVKAIGEKAGIEVIVIGDVDQVMTLELRNARKRCRSR